jgi:Mn-dependent DtxR family transcriptional regulator
MREEVNIMENKAFLTVEEVAAEMGVSKSYAYKIVKKLNEELQQMGYLTVAGRINANYFRKKVCYMETA